jgi:hypothetical protein
MTGPDDAAFSPAKVDEAKIKRATINRNERKDLIKEEFLKYMESFSALLQKSITRFSSLERGKHEHEEYF